MECWKTSKPAYVSKSSVLIGLKSIGDIDSINRIHTYLEQKGYINSGFRKFFYFYCAKKSTFIELESCYCNVSYYIGSFPLKYWCQFVLHSSTSKCFLSLNFLEYKKTNTLHYLLVVEFINIIIV